MPSAWLRRRILFLSACGLLLASGYHLAAMVWRTLDPTSSPLRHGVFVVINLATGAGLWLRPRGFFWVFAALTAQQLHSHGRALLCAFTQHQRVDWPSIIVLIGLPLMLWLLWQERSSPGRVRSP